MEKSRPLFFVVLMTIVLGAFVSCNSDTEDTVTQYLEWNNENVAYFNAAKTAVDEDGNRIYEVVKPNWDTTSCILMHYYTRGEGTVSPYYTSFVKVCYRGEMIDGVVFDSSHVSPSNPMTAKVSSLVNGWAVAMEKMHVGDSCRIVIPQNMGYASAPSGSVKPYSTLIFDVKLLEITRQ